MITNIEIIGPLVWNIEHRYGRNNNKPQIQHERLEIQSPVRPFFRDSSPQPAPAIAGPAHAVSHFCLTTYNVESIKSNHVYVEELFRTCDILCLQEHWLHTFEKHQIERLMPGCKAVVRCFDEDGSL